MKEYEEWRKSHLPVLVSSKTVSNSLYLGD